MSANGEFLTRQLGIIQAAIKLPFDPDPVFNNDATRVVAGYLDAAGTTDIRHLRRYDNPAASLGFFYDVATAHVFQNGAAIVNGGVGGDVSYSADPAARDLFDQFDGRFDSYAVYLRFSPDGWPIFFARRTKLHNDWNESFKGVLIVASVVVSAGFPGFAAYLGGTILGPEVAAAYPLLASGLGNVVISTTLNGGDVQSAVVGALSGGVGAEVGGVVASASDSAIIGAAAASATRAVIVGGDVQQAVAGSLLSSGINSAAQLPVFQQGVTMDDQTTIDTTPAYHDPVYDQTSLPPDVFTLPDPTTGLDPLAPPDLGPYGYGNSQPVDGGVTTGYHDPAWSVDGSAEGASVPMPGVTSPPPGPSGILASAGGGNLTQLAMTGLKLVSAWSGAGQPAIRTSNATVRANTNGTLTTANGTSTRMPVGTPYLTTANSLVTNNGDGTFTTVSATGGISTQAYAAVSSGLKSISIGGMQVSPVVLGAAAVGAFLLLRR